MAKIPKKREAPIDKNHPTFNLENNQSDKHNKVNHKNIDGQIGFPLLIGFLFMFVIEQLTKMGAYGRNSSKSVSTIGLVIHAFGLIFLMLKSVSTLNINTGSHLNI